MPSAVGAAKLAAVAVLSALAGGLVGAFIASRTPAIAPPPRANVHHETSLVRPEATSANAPPPPSVFELRGGEERPTPRPPAAPRPEEDLEEQRTLLDLARAALSRGNAEAATDALDRHARRFPHGQLAEERDGLRVIALARTDPERARAEAARFARRHPSSVLRPAIERALREIDHTRDSGL